MPRLATPGEHQTLTRYPLLALLHPREQTRLVVLLVPVGLLLWGVGAFAVGMPIWGATTVPLSLLLVPGVLKWHWVVNLITTVSPSSTATTDLDLAWKDRGDAIGNAHRLIDAQVIK